ncbi:MAG: stage II sporulation protein P [Ruminococcus sp.]|nr:stage II sporulation protein P [Ruminococcus sp.]
MTEKEKRFPAGSVRVYHVKRIPRNTPKKPLIGRKALSAAGIALLAVWCAFPEGGEPQGDTAASALKGAAAVSRLCAKAETVGITDIISRSFKKFTDETQNMYENENTVNNSINGGSMITVSSEDDMLMLSQGAARMPSSLNEEYFSEDFLPPPSENAGGVSEDAVSELPYPESFGADGIVTPITYTFGKGENYIDLPSGGQLRNVTSLGREEILANALLAPDFGITLDAPEDLPQVLIMHTHTTESYQPENTEYYDKSYIFRTTDSDKNMTAVGNAMTEVFESRGIRVYHDTTVHDHPSYNGSYDRSRATVTDILEKYPSIKVVLDVHRDAIEREGGEIIAPTAEINGKSCAQVMIICGCDDGTMGMPECMKNLRTAALFDQYMESAYPGLTRPVLYDYRKYNQDLTTGSLLLEIGGHGNSLSQAVYAGRLTADAISDALISTAENREMYG